LKNAEELLNLQFSPKSVTINKPRRMWSAWHVTRTGEARNMQNFSR
jgi:hypothetical protein